MSEWPEPVERVAAALREAGVDARLEQFPAGTLTAEDAARAVGCTLPQIVKSIVFECDGRAIVVLVPGDRRADATKVASATGCRKARIAGPGRVEEATGFPPGGVAPFALREVDTILMDPGLLAHDEVWVGAGSTSHVAGLTPGDLARLSQAKLVDTVQPGG